MAFWGEWGRYVPVAERRAKARREMDKLRKKGKNIQPVTIDGRTIARSFWGKGWCDHLESFSDYANRLPRGRTYVRNGSVCHLDIRPGVSKPSSAVQNSTISTSVSKSCKPPHGPPSKTHVPGISARCSNCSRASCPTR